MSHFRNSDEKMPVVPLYRGINFCSDIFHDAQSRKSYINNNSPGVTILESLHINKSIERIRSYAKLEISEERAKMHQILPTNFMFQFILRQSKIKNNMTLRSKKYDEYHKNYSNNYGKNNNSFQFNKYDTQFVDNPFLSFSKNPLHAIKYAYGLDKKYSSHTPLIARYTANGKPRISTIGVIQVIFVKKEDLAKLGICDVNREIGRPGQRKFNEHEVTLDGYAFPENFVFQIEAKLPSLMANSNDCVKIGLSINVTRNWKSAMHNSDYYIKKHLIPSLMNDINGKITDIAKTNNLKLTNLEDLRR